MDRSSVSRRFPCAVCGCESTYRSGWFLVVENKWLDRLRVLYWHPSLAEQSEMSSVCGKQHLKLLILLWLTQASLKRSSVRPAAWQVITDDPASLDIGEPVTAGKLVGELAVQREARSHNWTGSPEALEAIVDAMIGGDDAPESPTSSLANQAMGFSTDLSWEEILTDA